MRRHVHLPILSPAITVAVRMRPLNQHERVKGSVNCTQVDVSGSEVRLSLGGSASGETSFAFDHVYDGETTQHAIYEVYRVLMMKPVMLSFRDND